MPSYLAPILPGSTVAQRIQAGTRSTHQPPGCCRRTLTLLPWGIAGEPDAGSARAAARRTSRLSLGVSRSMSTYYGLPASGCIYPCASQ